MHYRVLAVVVLALLAGCGSVIGGGTGEESVTPAPVPTQTPDGSQYAVAPGVAADGIEDRRALIRAHRSVVRNTSFRWDERTRLTFGTAEEQKTRSRVRWAVYEDVDRYRSYTSSINRLGATNIRYVRNYERYGDNRTAYLRWEDPAGIEIHYERMSNHRHSRNLGVPILNLERYLELENQTVTRVGTGEQPHYEIRGTRTNLSGFGELETFEARAIVREDGLVRQVNVSFVEFPDGESVTVEYWSRYSQLGRAEVTTPEWLPEARARTNASSEDAL